MSAKVLLVGCVASNSRVLSTALTVIHGPSGVERKRHARLNASRRHASASQRFAGDAEHPVRLSIGYRRPAALFQPHVCFDLLLALGKL